MGDLIKLAAFLGTLLLSYAILSMLLQYIGFLLPPSPPRPLPRGVEPLLCSPGLRPSRRHTDSIQFCMVAAMYQKLDTEFTAASGFRMSTKQVLRLALE